MNYRQKGGDDVCCETVEGAAFERCRNTCHHVSVCFAIRHLISYKIETYLNILATDTRNMNWCVDVQKPVTGILKWHHWVRTSVHAFSLFWLFLLIHSNWSHYDGHGLTDLGCITSVCFVIRHLIFCRIETYLNILATDTRNMNWCVDVRKPVTGILKWYHWVRTSVHAFSLFWLFFDNSQ